MDQDKNNVGTRWNLGEGILSLSEIYQSVVVSFDHCDFRKKIKPTTTTTDI
jgi:hypothetical protein